MDNTIIYKDVARIADACNLEELRDKNILLTGASGLFGTYILFTLNELCARGIVPHQVYAVVHRTVPEHLKELENCPWLTFMQGDLADDSFCSALPMADYIIHASGYGQPKKFLEEPIRALRQNTMATFALIDKMERGGKFLYVSSGAVYAENPKDEYFENDISFATLDHPRICYIEGKRCGETICELFRRQGKDIKIVRPSFTYGPGVRSDDVRVLYEFIRKGLRGDIHMLDQGAGVHVYEYISDIAEEMWNVLLHGKQNVYNLAGYSEISIYELAKQIGELLCVGVVTPLKNDTVPGAMMKQRVNSDRVKAEFGKQNFISLKEGLSNTVAWYCANYGEKIKRQENILS